ncbi:MAG: host attachment protein [Devosiaceae bacterium]|nr:host attachment protein [Devosiaceae bacterium]
MKPVITWILIADGARARVLEHKGPGSGLIAIRNMEFSSEKLTASDIMADKPGRAFASTGNARSAIEPRTDPVAKREADFVRMLAETLQDPLAKSRFDRLILVAAPRALGELRKALSTPLTQSVYAEIAKDLTKVPNDQIAKHLKQVMVI